MSKRNYPDLLEFAETFMDYKLTEWQKDILKKLQQGQRYVVCTPRAGRISFQKMLKAYDDQKKL